MKRQVLFPVAHDLIFSPKFFAAAYSIYAASFLILIGIEYSFSVIRGPRVFGKRGTLTNVVLFLGYLASTYAFIVLIVYEALRFVHQYSLFKIPASQFLLLFVVDDLFYYIYHRVAHRFRLVWTGHIAHHSSDEFNLSVGGRLPWVSIIYYLSVLPLALIGFDPVMIIAARDLNLVFQSVLHTRLIRSFGPLDLIFNSPAHHRVHHARQPQYWGKNLGGSLIIWDRLFGTFAEEKEPAIFGIGSDISVSNPIRITFEGWWQIYKKIRKRGLIHSLAIVGERPHALDRD